MARLFNDANSQGLYVNTAVVSVADVNAGNLTMGGMFYADAAVTQTMGGVFDKDVAGNPRVYVFLHSGGTVRYFTQGTTFANAITTATWSTNTWHHACGRTNSASSRDVFLDGANKVNEGTTATLTGTLDRTTVGYAGDSTASSWFSGRIAEWFVYNVALSDAEIAALGTDHVSPLLVRPQSLVFYYPGLADDKELMEAYSLTFVGSGSLSTADHPRMYYPSRQLQIGVPQPAAAGRTTYNTRSHPLGQNIGMGHRMVG